MGALHKQFKTDANMEKDGIILDYGPNEDLPKGEDGEHSPPDGFHVDALFRERLNAVHQPVPSADAGRR